MPYFTVELFDILNLPWPNSCYINFYAPHGRQGVLFHADDEDFKAEEGVTIVSVSIGDSRNFQVCKIGNKQQLEVDQRLNSGDVVVMAGQMQKHDLHQIPLAYGSGNCGRFNLTFRTITCHHSHCTLSTTA